MSSWHWVWLEALEHAFLFLYLLQVRHHNDSGMYEDASKASKQAGLYAKIGILIGSISLAVGLIISVIVIVANVVFAAATVQAVTTAAE